MAQTVASFSLQALACGGAFRMPCASVQIRSGGDIYIYIQCSKPAAKRCDCETIARRTCSHNGGAPMIGSHC